MTSVLPLSEITLTDIDRVGGKAAHLGAMQRAGFNVPDGFVIDVNAFIDHFGQQTDPLVKPPPPRLQPELMAQVVEALRDYLGNEDQLAVRSSSTEEDGYAASYAGQHSTYYFVPPKHIDQAILDCWMSLWSDAALSYRRAGWTEIASGEPVRMAVIVQKMITSERSGVAFSRDPIDSANTETVIEAAWGLGAALVDGRVSPDHVRVTEEGLLSSYVVADKLLQVKRQQASNDGSRLEPVPNDRRNDAVLATAEAEQIANVSKQLETLFETPQDVEWAYTADELHILQSRPITSLSARPATEEQLVLFKPVAENFTEPLTPMSRDLFGSALPKIGAIYQGRFYVDLALLRFLTPFDLTDSQLAELALLNPRDGFERLSPWKTFRLILFLIAGFLIDGANWIRTARVTPEALHRYRHLAERIADNHRYGPRRTLRRLIWGSHPFEPIAHQMFYTNVSAGRYFLFLGLLHRAVSRFAPDFDVTDLSRIYHRQNDMASLTLVQRMAELGQMLNQTGNQEDTQALMSAISGTTHTLPAGHPFTLAFEAFLDDFGHRGPREIELAAPRWRENPGELLEFLRHHTVGEDRDTAYGSHLAARDELHQHLKPWQCRFVDYLIEKISRYITLRENTRQYHILAFSVTRQKLLQIEQELLDQRLLRVEGDIFFLTMDEVESLRAGTLDPTEANQITRRRRREWRALARFRPEPTINVDYNPPAERADLSGLCASPGVATARAVTVFSLSHASELSDGDILVAPYTDPAWTPLFTRASGVILETGSFLSHAGTVARELQVPCLVEVKGCTDRIKTGDWITLDATAGQVHQHEGAP